ncbi:hypothetical protein PsAD2_03043 [Pseudovibrio axinellae]|uniref:Uncharacterized protein n=1 Tax=Pseudovibrio axinellae TaxID=989403 RepID=A0A165XHJ6_9HYPH|nr:hypothetical protein [Pseudovibrio axinellae]KZL17706.1 hypothetical protein PsAD2_03043 [Pseudovibrio axinellae]SER42887.1 hypothetical protein SAMN05421798_11038 [Pseudovibrio axinellae]
MIGFILSTIGVGLHTLVAYLALAGAALAFAARLDPRIPKALSTLVSVLLLCVSVWSFSALHYARYEEVADLKARVAALDRIAQVHKRIAQKTNADLLERIVQVGSLQQQVADYEIELEKGSISACPADPAYIERMRALQFGGAQ